MEPDLCWRRQLINYLGKTDKQIVCVNYLEAESVISTDFNLYEDTLGAPTITAMDWKEGLIQFINSQQGSYYDSKWEKEYMEEFRGLGTEDARMSSKNPGGALKGRFGSNM